MGRPAKRVEIECLQCGKKIEARPSEIETGRKKFCSISCGTTYRNIHNNPTRDPSVRAKISLNHANVSGEKNPMYGKRGEKAPSYIDGRNSFSGETYRKKLLASGVKKECCICGSAEMLHVHHKDGNHKNNVISNLEWVCVRCHNNVLHTYLRDESGRFTGSVLSAT